MAPIASAASFGPLASLVGWFFIPNFVTSLVLRGFYSVLPTQRPVLSAHPRPEEVDAANAKARSHHRIAHTLVIGGYLVYTLIQAYTSLTGDPNHYTILGLRTVPYEMVSSEMWESTLKQQWRAVVRVAHPDKVGQAGEAAFVAMRTAYETLGDPLKKEAYDRFGHDVILRCHQRCSTRRDYVINGVTSSIPFYVVVVGSLFLLGVTRKKEQGNYWRYVLLAGLAAAEFGLATRPLNRAVTLAATLGLAPWQLSVFLHHLYVAATMAINQLGPFFFPLPPTEEDLGAALRPLVAKSRMLALENDADAFLLSNADMQPLTTAADQGKLDPVVLRRLQQAVEEQCVAVTIRSNQEGAAAWRKAIVDAPKETIKVPKREEVEDEGLREADSNDQERVFDLALAKAEEEEDDARLDSRSVTSKAKRKAR